MSQLHLQYAMSEAGDRHLSSWYPIRMPHSPLKDSPLARGPGDSLLRLMMNKAIEPAMMWHIGLVMSMGVLLGMLFSQRPIVVSGISLWPVVAGAAFVVCASVMAVRWRSWMRQIDNIHKGRAGEQAAAAVLAELGKDGYIIAHDVPLNALDPAQFEGPNIDHLLIGPAGVFVIETKYVAKSRADGRANEVTFDQNADGGKGRLCFNGLKQDRCALEQVRRNAKVVDVFLRSKQLEHAVPVTPIVFVLGWMVKVPTSLDVRVLNPKLVFPYLRGMPKVLDARQVGKLYESILPASTREDSTAELFE